MSARYATSKPSVGAARLRPALLGGDQRPDHTVYIDHLQPVGALGAQRRESVHLGELLPIDLREVMAECVGLRDVVIGASREADRSMWLNPGLLPRKVLPPPAFWRA